MIKFSICISLLAAITFLVMAFLGFRGQPNSLHLFRYSINIYSLLMIFNEIVEWMNGNKMTKVSNGVAVMGYLTYLMASYLTNTFIQGNIYLIASFLITLSPILKMLNLVLERQKTVRDIRKNPLQCSRLMCFVGVGVSLFLVAAGTGFMAEHFKEQAMEWLVGLSYLMGFILHLAIIICEGKSSKVFQLLFDPTNPQSSPNTSTLQEGSLFAF